jgi:hypothetical protein
MKEQAVGFQAVINYTHDYIRISNIWQFLEAVA